MANVIGHNGPLYNGKTEATGGSRPIKTTVKLPTCSKDNFSHKAEVRHTKIDDMPQTYENMNGGHKEEKE